ncbi:MAG: hypothetical protein JSS60_07080 [Verrucomicrobia bacterium]|nr:hypothetical protein [Verrucomicrobiota bacterium]
MSVSTISSNVQKLTSETEGFEFRTASLLGPLQGRQLKIGAVEGNHQEVMQVFKKTMQDVANLKLKIQGLTTYSNQEEMILYAEAATNLESRLESALIRMNDTLLTSYPTARIEYGRQCIGPKKAPTIEGASVALQKTLSTCSAIREIRGDGNCFAAAFTTRFLEMLVARKAVSEFIEFVAHDGIDQPELKSEVINRLMELQEYPSQIDNVLGDNSKILPFISYFRHLAADEMKKNSVDENAQFLAALMQEYTVQDLQIENFDQFEHLLCGSGVITKETMLPFLEKYVINMGFDFCAGPIMALSKRLQFPVAILYSDAPHRNITTTINQSSKDKVQNDEKPPQATFCRKGAHYFVLYTPEESAPIVQTSPTASQPTEIRVKCAVPHGHALFICGSGSGLNWDGIPMRELGNDEWGFTPRTPLADGTECKFRVNGDIWEEGHNRKITQGKMSGEAPRFSKMPEAIKDTPIAPVQLPQVVIKCAVPHGNTLFICGSGSGLNWDGIPLKELGNNEWGFTPTTPLVDGTECKFRINGDIWEEGHNRKITQGKIGGAEPRFTKMPTAIQDMPLEPVRAPQIVIKCAVPQGNALFLCGSGSGLNWVGGAPLRELGNDEWGFTPQTPLVDGTECKFRINDDIWEEGHNRKIAQGKISGDAPRFNKMPKPISHF